MGLSFGAMETLSCYILGTKPLNQVLLWNCMWTWIFILEIEMVPSFCCRLRYNPLKSFGLIKSICFRYICDPMDCSPPGSSIHGILQARILEWLSMPSSRGSSQARDQTKVSHITYGFFTVWATREALVGLRTNIWPTESINWGRNEIYLIRVH